jgi:hypothetical protein
MMVAMVVGKIKKSRGGGGEGATTTQERKKGVRIRGRSCRAWRSRFYVGSTW